MKKLIAKVMILGMLGAGAYLAVNTDYKRIPDVWHICKKVVFQKQDYSKVLVSELEQNAQSGDEIIESGYKINKKLFGNRKTADKFAEHPYDLRIRIEHSSNGEAAYLVDNSNGQVLPIYKGIQVGDLEHRLKGISEEAKEEALKIINQAKQFTSSTIEKYLKDLR